MCAAQQLQHRIPRGLHAPATRHSGKRGSERCAFTALKSHNGTTDGGDELCERRKGNRGVIRKRMMNLYRPFARTRMRSLSTPLFPFVHELHGVWRVASPRIIADGSHSEFSGACPQLEIISPSRCFFGCENCAT